MIRMNYKYIVLGTLPCSIRDLNDIAVELFGSSRRLWKIDEDDNLVTIMSFARSKDREQFVECFEALGLTRVCAGR